MNNTVTAQTEYEFAFSAEAVYDAWLTPEAIKKWMKASLQANGLPGQVERIEVDPVVGGKFFFSDMRKEGEACHWGTYLKLERPNLIQFTWIVDESEEESPSVVTVEIVSTEGGCKATVSHEMDAQWAEYKAQVEKGWSCFLIGIDKAYTDGEI